MMTTLIRACLLSLQITLFIFLLGITGCQSLPSDKTGSNDTGDVDPQAGFETRPGTTGDVIRATPYFIGGKQRGYRLMPSSDSEPFEELGLLPGDLLVEVDGRPQTNPRGAIELFDRLDRGDSVVAKINREGEIIEVELNMN